MIVDERYTTYLNSLYPELSPVLKAIQKEAIETYVPIIRPETINLLQLLIHMNRPKRILEVGAAVGFSANLMAEAAGDDVEIITIENYEPRIPIANANFKRTGRDKQITLLEGDAQDILPTLDGPFDFVFMDAAKGQYINFWPEVKRLTRDGGVIVTDNVLQDGDIIESRFAITRRNRTIHKRMRDYLYELTHDEGFSTTILPLGDGVSISVKGML
ncbi:O-methyltransferase [Pseudobutyrivibrio xylanivorans]|uniref:tRNA 5-hydroxyuridine methyltransferase n=1 Tax=Pseudobutyrivibrio xylanivorans TaxID=185007 RepID=A0A5P6VTP8_PSEXY|nr:O-methyltransferase [Pseudobutyrivibrio xylanivorans]QFJ55732.1 O-methyltransferase [Pseudobutyrivibrio xylanivorans]